MHAPRLVMTSDFAFDALKAPQVVIQECAQRDEYLGKAQDELGLALQIELEDQQAFLCSRAGLMVPIGGEVAIGSIHLIEMTLDYVRACASRLRFIESAV